jgi:small-conductance mechanosensitive channel
VDLQELRQPQLTKQAAKVKARTRPWRAIIALVLAIAAAGVSWTFGHNMKNLFEPGHLADSIVATSGAVGFFVFATIAVLAFASRARQALESVTGSAHAAVIRYTIMLVGAILVIVITLVLLKVPVAQLLVGGAFATIIITIAGQQTLSNIFAGLVLLLSRPFRIGDSIVLRSGALGGQHEGTVTEIGITYLQLDTGDDLMRLPNSQVLAAAVSPRTRSTQPTGPDSGETGRPPAAATAGTAATVPATGAIERSATDARGQS